MQLYDCPLVSEVRAMFGVSLATGPLRVYVGLGGQ